MSQFSDLPALPFQQGGKIIHFSRDHYGRMLVIDDGNQRILNFDSLFEQSCMQLSHPYQLVHQYTQFMALAVAFVDPLHITLLGLGGGSLLRTLHHLLPDCHFHVVELRQSVVEIAKDYFSMPADHRVDTTVNDAFEAISVIESHSSDIIFSDIYDAYRMAPGQIQNTFLVECCRVLRHHGWLVLNLHGFPDDRSAFRKLLGDIFPTLLMCNTAENHVLFASRTPPDQIEPDPLRIDKIERKLRQRYLQLLPRLQPLNDDSRLIASQFR